MTDPRLPDGLTPLRAAGAAVGWLSDDWRDRALAPPSPFVAGPDGLTLAAADAGFDVASAALARWARALQADGRITGWRDERCVVHDDAGRSLFEVERALLRPLGLRLRSALATVWTRRAAGPVIWVARRADTKPVDPGRLDALVGGGITGPDDAWATLLRECGEEAGLPESIARRARPAGRLDLCHPAVDDGLMVLHREWVTLYELELPADLVPRNTDGEHDAIVAMTPAEAIASIDDGGWTRDGAQATLDLIGRHGWLGPVGPQPQHR